MSRRKNPELVKAQAEDMYQDRINGLTFRQIAAKYNVNVKTAFSWIKEFDPGVDPEKIETWREHEIEKLDDLEAKLWAVIGKDHYRVDHGKLIRLTRDSDEEPLTDDEPTMRAIDRLLKVSERRSKLVGLDKPAQQEVTVKREIQDDELLEVLNKAKEAVDAQERDIVDAEVVEPPELGS